ncbi:YheC/YheD family protein [Halobacillus halophilus]|uniref:YheC/YheD family protein n=1 Tax=Halobacillus halophilus TaxID=1570 RepID=UPI001CD52D8C|nr:YheC/YheD family protein [Halobacillus halophilus]MCA1011487.1 YheC/YheD family protein [Halobacillus halophilus]
MTLIGMLHYRKKPHHVKKAYACAAEAKMQNIGFVYFSYGAVDFSSKKINGWFFEDGDWVLKETRFPDTIINISAPKTKQQSIIRKGLKKNIPFVSHSIGSKMRVFKKIAQGRQFAKHLIPTASLETPDVAISFIEEYQQTVIKPHSGSKGLSVHFVSLTKENNIQCITGAEDHIYSMEEFKQYLSTLISERKYLIQPFIECKTKAGLTYDFRLHVQKNEHRKWAITLIYPRISGGKKLTSNVSSGGYRGELIPFLKDEFDDKYFDVKQLLEYFAITFAEHFEGLYQNKSFDELGIDVAIDQEWRIWIYEVNWRPGSKNREFSVAKQIVPYAKTLAEKAREEKERH